MDLGKKIRVIEVEPEPEKITGPVPVEPKPQQEPVTVP